MKNKELIKLPLNRLFEITDGNYTYILKKTNSDIGIHYMFREKGGNPYRDRFSVFEEEIQDEDDIRVKYKKLRYCASIGAFTFYGDFYMPNFFTNNYNWSIVTDMCLKKYMALQFSKPLT